MHYGIFNRVPIPHVVIKIWTKYWRRYHQWILHIKRRRNVFDYLRIKSRKLRFFCWKIRNIAITILPLLLPLPLKQQREFRGMFHGKMTIFDNSVENHVPIDSNNAPRQQPKMKVFYYRSTISRWTERRKIIANIRKNKYLIYFQKIFFFFTSVIINY